MYSVIIINMLKCEAVHILESHLISGMAQQVTTEADKGRHVNTVVIPCLHPAPAVHGRPFINIELWLVA